MYVLIHINNIDREIMIGMLHTYSEIREKSENQCEWIKSTID